MGRGYKSCADCSIEDLRTCKTNHNIISKTFGFIFNTDRIAGLELIRKDGYEAFAAQMSAINCVSLKRKK